MSVGAWSLAEARALVLSEADWAPSQSPAFLVELDRYLWLATREAAARMPELFWERTTIVVQPFAQNSGAATDRLRTVTGDLLVLERPTTEATRTAWDFTGLWDSWNLWATDTTGRTRRYRAHEFWEDAETSTERVSLDKPFSAPTTGMTWKLFQDPWPLPADVMSIVDVRFFDATTQGWRQARGITEQQMDAMSVAGMSGFGALIAGNLPACWCPGPQWNMQPPRHTPTVANAGTWEAAGDDTGTWEYCYTIVWGVQDADALDPHGNLDPSWESPPSPVSAQATSVAGAAGAITISWPAPDFIAHYTGLPTTGSVRNGRSGYKVCLYARRVSDTETPAANELAGFYRLAFVSVMPGTYVHDGTQQLVYERPLRAQSTVNTIRFWPHAGLRYEVDLRVVRAPRPMVVANDVVPMPHEAQQLVALIARAKLADKCKEHGVAKDIRDVQVPAKIKEITDSRVHGNRTFIRGECAARHSTHPYTASELEYMFLGTRST
jgi:hypothetical protein